MLRSHREDSAFWIRGTVSHIEKGTDTERGEDFGYFCNCINLKIGDKVSSVYNKPPNAQSLTSAALSAFVIMFMA